jgi:acyl-CoA synthetase (NDP forming)
MSEKQFLLEHDAAALLEEYDISYPRHGFAETAEKASKIASQLGYPVVLKVVSPDIVHKSDAGGVITDIQNEAMLSQAFENILKNVRSYHANADILGVLVCKQAQEGLEVIVGSVNDLMFGHALMFGLGGIFTEILDDVTFRIIPVSKQHVAEMITEIRGYPILSGSRGKSGYDINALSLLLLSVSKLVEEHPEIEELDLNPVRLYHEGVQVLDVRILRKSG